ncbi:hypothetical protein M0R45_001344 [Rubus argutus]|uniref:Uncharacterized protein n=1 Tax=Rubus argutus TaxID=59490 RepID=A0AAW1VN60_RUBAR
MRGRNAGGAARRWRLWSSSIASRRRSSASRRRRSGSEESNRVGEVGGLERDDGIVERMRGLGLGLGFGFGICEEADALQRIWWCYYVINGVIFGNWGWEKMEGKVDSLSVGITNRVLPGIFCLWNDRKTTGNWNHLWLDLGS